MEAVGSSSPDSRLVSIVQREAKMFVLFIKGAADPVGSLLNTAM